MLAVAAGEGLRLWAVRRIGAISRTRSDRLGPLIDKGPFSLVRNPLYLGNILIWLGLALSARLPWLALVIIVVLGFEYHAIVRWEERLLHSRLGAAYTAYRARVPRWLPRFARPESGEKTALYSWPDTFHSERGTLIAIVLGYGLLALKAQWVSLA
jgi:protein-S-isoprenylcysteine O-methyltransferase Ste14